MKSLERRFRNLLEKNPSWSTYTCFAEAVQNQNFGHDRLRRWFNLLVSKDDYAPEEKLAILDHLKELTMTPEAYRKRA